MHADANESLRRKMPKDVSNIVYFFTPHNIRLLFFTRGNFSLFFLYFSYNSVFLMCLLDSDTTHAIP
jgi:hypothetical protein